MGEVKVIEKQSEEELIKTVIDFATNKGFTIRNIKEAMEKVYEHFEDNAVIEKATEI